MDRLTQWRSIPTWPAAVAGYVCQRHWSIIHWNSYVTSTFRSQICEHRWRQIYNMARFRNVVAGMRHNIQFIVLSFEYFLHLRDWSEQLVGQWEQCDRLQQRRQGLHRHQQWSLLLSLRRNHGQSNSHFSKYNYLVFLLLLSDWNGTRSVLRRNFWK